MNADAELDRPRRRQARIAFDHAVLHFDRETHGVGDAAGCGARSTTKFSICSCNVGATRRSRGSLKAGRTGLDDARAKQSAFSTEQFAKQ